MIVAVESEWRNRKGKGTTEICFQIGRVCSAKSFLDFCLCTLCQVAILCACCAEHCVKFSKILRRLSGAYCLQHVYLTRILLKVVRKTRRSRYCTNDVWHSINPYQHCGIEYYSHRIH